MSRPFWVGRIKHIGGILLPTSEGAEEATETTVIFDCPKIESK